MLNTKWFNQKGYILEKRIQVKIFILVCISFGIFYSLNQKDLPHDIQYIKNHLHLYISSIFQKMSNLNKLGSYDNIDRIYLI